MKRAEAATRLSMIFANCDTEMCKGAYVCKYCDEAINMAIKALQQEPKRGEWIMHPEGKFVGFPYVHYECSECRAFVPEDTEYCPRCGARMESDEE